MNDIAVADYDDNDEYFGVDDDDRDDYRYRLDDDDYMQWRQEKEWNRKRAELDEINHHRSEGHRYDHTYDPANQMDETEDAPPRKKASNGALSLGLCATALIATLAF